MNFVSVTLGYKNFVLDCLFLFHFNSKPFLGWAPHHHCTQKNYLFDLVRYSTDLIGLLLLVEDGLLIHFFLSFYFFLSFFSFVEERRRPAVPSGWRMRPGAELNGGESGHRFGHRRFHRRPIRFQLRVHCIRSGGRSIRTEWRQKKRKEKKATSIPAPSPPLISPRSFPVSFFSFFFSISIYQTFFHFFKHEVNDWVVYGPALLVWPRWPPPTPTPNLARS